MKKMVAAAALMFAALGAHAQALPQAALGADPLTRQILSKSAQQENGGVTAAVAVKGLKGSVALDLSDGSAAPAALAPAATSPDAPLKPAAGLARKRPAKAKKDAAKPLHRATEQLRHLGSRDGKNWGERR